MTIPDSAFRYLPDLLGKVIQPEDSKMRLSMDDLHTFDKNARKQGRPKPWRLSDEDRESNRKKTLEGNMDKDLWVLAYGSLIWDPSSIPQSCVRPGCPGVDDISVTPRLSDAARPSIPA